MKLLLLILGSLVSFYTVAQEKILKESYYPDGTLRYKGYVSDDQRSGEMTHYYPGGKVKAVLTYNGAETHAVLHDKNGGFIVSGVYLDKKKTGKWEYRKGEWLLLKEEYMNDKLEGVSERYFKSGIVAEIKHWKAGSVSGEWKLFYDNGQVRVQTFYMDGKLNGIIKTFDYDGVLLVEGEYRNNLKEGEWKYYNRAEKSEKRQRFEAGVSVENEQEALEMTRKIDMLVRKGTDIADPAEFADDPEAYMRITE